MRYLRVNTIFYVRRLRRRGSVKVIEDSGPESTTYRTTKVIVSKAKSERESTFDRKASEDAHDYNVSEKAFLTKKRAIIKRKGKKVIKNDKD